MVLDKVKDVLALHLNMDMEDITLESDLVEDFHIDSLDIVEIIMDMENEFNIETADDSLPDVKNVQDIVDYIEKCKR